MENTELVSRMVDYLRPGYDNEDFFLSGKKLGKKYPIWEAFLNPAVQAVVIDSDTGSIISTIGGSM